MKHILNYTLILIPLFAGAGCAGATVETRPVATRVLGQATVYISATGEKLEIVHDPRAGVAIVKLPDGGMAVLPAEIAGQEGRYNNDRMSVWEQNGSASLFIDGKAVFSGREK